jgi:hypothetical protein
VGSIAWFFVGFLYFDVLFYYPIIGLIFGFIAIFNGLAKQKKADTIENKSDSLLDDF